MFLKHPPEPSFQIVGLTLIEKYAHNHISKSHLWLVGNCERSYLIGNFEIYHLRLN